MNFVWNTQKLLEKGHENQQIPPGNPHALTQKGSPGISKRKSKKYISFCRTLLGPPKPPLHLEHEIYKPQNKNSNRNTVETEAPNTDKTTEAILFYHKQVTK